MFYKNYPYELENESFYQLKQSAVCKNNQSGIFCVQKNYLKYFLNFLKDDLQIESSIHNILLVFCIPLQELMLTSLASLDYPCNTELHFHANHHHQRAATHLLGNCVLFGFTYVLSLVQRAQSGLVVSGLERVKFA